MSAWMEYKFMQQAKPTNATGVPVTLTAIDPNGNYVPVGDTTSDMDGNYGLPFTPEVSGTYHIFASFAGSKSYGSSSATTYLTIGNEATAQPTEQPQLALPPTEMYFTISTAAIIVAIAIATILIIRKRP
jgi:hypothetical protein